MKMLRLMKLGIVFFFILLLSACAPKKISSNVDEAEFTINSTNKKDVYELLGQPHSLTKDQKNHTTVWFYLNGGSKFNPMTFVPYAGLVFGGNDIELSVSRLTFNDESLELVSIVKSEIKRYINQWVGMTGASHEKKVSEELRGEMLEIGEAFDEEINKKVRYHGFHTLLVNEYGDKSDAPQTEDAEKKSH